MAAIETAPRDDGGSSTTLDLQLPTSSAFTFLAPAPFASDSPSTGSTSSCAGLSGSLRAGEGPPPPHRRRAAVGRRVQAAVDWSGGEVKARGSEIGRVEYEERPEGARQGEEEEESVSACSSDGGERASSDDHDLPRRPHKRICRRPPVDNEQHLFPRARSPHTSPVRRLSQSLPPPQQLLDVHDRPPSTTAPMVPDELGFYNDRASDSSDSDEESCGPPSQPLSDAETSGENQLRRTPPAPCNVARLSLSPIDNMSTLSLSATYDPASSTSSAPRARSTAWRRTASPARTALAAGLSALDLASASCSASTTGHNDLDEREDSSQDEREGASLEAEQGWRFEECPVGSFASGRDSAW